MAKDLNMHDLYTTYYSLSYPIAESPVDFKYYLKRIENIISQVKINDRQCPK